MSRLIKRTGLIAFMICLLVSCREQAVYDVVIVGGGPAGIGAALGASGAGEYYLDTLAVLPEYRRRGIAAGYDLITLVVDSNMPDLIRLYESVDFLRMTYSVKRQNAKL